MAAECERRKSRMSWFKQRANVKFCRKFWRKRPNLGVAIMSVATRQRSCTLVYACRGIGKETGRRFFFSKILHTPLISHQAISFSFPASKKTTWVWISVGRRDRHCYKSSRTGYSSQCLSVVFPVAIPTLADIHSGVL